LKTRAPAKCKRTLIIGRNAGKLYGEFLEPSQRQPASSHQYRRKITISTRRFCACVSSVSFLTSGRWSAYPAASRRRGATRCSAGSTLGDEFFGIGRSFQPQCCRSRSKRVAAASSGAVSSGFNPGSPSAIAARRSRLSDDTNKDCACVDC